MKKNIKFTNEEKGNFSLFVGVFFAFLTWGLASNFALGVAAGIAGFIATVAFLCVLEKE
jgi:predicted lipid-binding transport protein (Tim44 family)